ncbi:MAG: peptide ABC transporter substrate-binding protein [Erysipelotrichaceae bacterium]|nr:peptide ABC transporter substrate-binding protein [Erysipelotrichaceae bacterium]
MKKLITLLLAVLMVLSLAACGGNGGDTPNTEVTYKDTFTYAIGGEPYILDPGYASDSVSAYVVNQTYYPLFYIGEDGSMMNAACESYTVSEDGMVYTLKLVQNKWSDGVECTAKDYVYGMKHALSLGGDDSYYSYFIGDYVKNAKAHVTNQDAVADMDDIGIVAVDDYTIEITLENDCPYFLSFMAAGVFYPLREEYATTNTYAWAADPTVPTNGAYHYESIDLASEIVMVKNDYFCNADQVTTSKLVCKVMSDQDAQLLAFQAGEIDMATALNATEVAKVYEGKPELMISDSVINYYMMVNAYTSIEPLKDVRVRRALQLGIDRSAIVTALDADAVYYELYGYVPKGFAGAEGDYREEVDNVQPLVYTDKEAAKALLAEAGYADGFELEYYYNQNAMHDTVAAVIKAQYAEIGIDVKLKTGEIRTFFADRNDGLFQICRGAMSADYMDVTTFLDMALTWTQGTITWGDTDYDNMILATRKMTGTERVAALHDAEQYMIETQCYSIPLFGYKNVTLGKAGLKNAWTNPQANHIYWYVQCPAD